MHIHTHTHTHTNKTHSVYAGHAKLSHGVLLTVGYKLLIGLLRVIHTGAIQPPMLTSSFMGMTPEDPRHAALNITITSSRGDTHGLIFQ